MKKFENIEIKNVITLVALIIWIGTTAYGVIIGEFNTVFEFFKTVFATIIAFFLGRQTGKTEAETEAVDPIPTSDNYE